MEDIFYKKQKLRSIDLLGVVMLIIFISIVWIGIATSIRSNRELKQNLEATGCLAKDDDGREYELGKVEAFGHEFITFHENCCFGVEHSPDCPCHSVDKGELK